MARTNPYGPALSSSGVDLCENLRNFTGGLPSGRRLIRRKNQVQQSEPRRNGEQRTSSSEWRIHPPMVDAVDDRVA